jgi:hypothetical protein
MRKRASIDRKMVMNNVVLLCVTCMVYGTAHTHTILYTAHKYIDTIHTLHTNTRHTHTIHALHTNTYIHTQHVHLTHIHYIHTSYIHTHTHTYTLSSKGVTYRHYKGDFCVMRESDDTHSSAHTHIGMRTLTHCHTQTHSHM